MLPDSITVPELYGSDEVDNSAIAFKVLQELNSGIKDNHGMKTVKKELSTTVNKKDANDAIKYFAAATDSSNAMSVLNNMVAANIPILQSSLAEVMKMFNKRKEFDLCIKMFDQLDTIYSVPHPNPIHWACLIKAKTKDGFGDVADGLKILKHLEKSGVALLADMYNPILRGLMHERRNDDVFDYWCDMKFNGVVPNIESYNIMIEQCEVLGKPERAFFLMDELKLLDIEPDRDTFCRLFRACATAPVWVNGYQDIIFDAMAKMEGKELIPDLKVYNSVLYAFGKVGDGAAADFYLNEMKNKNIMPDVKSYNLVISGYAS